MVLFVGSEFEFVLCHSGVKKKIKKKSWAGRCSTFTLFMNYGCVHVFLEEKSRVKAY